MMRSSAATSDPWNSQMYSFRSDLGSIGLLEMLLDELRERLALKDDVFRSIWISVNEAISNAILHGNKCDPLKKVLLWIELHHDDVICFRIRDEGKGFDPASIPDPTSAERITEPNGRGVFLMNSLADHLAYKENGTEVEMAFTL